MYNLNMNSLVNPTIVQNPPTFVIPNAIHINVPNINIDCNYALHIVVESQKSYHSYMFSSNMIYLQVICYRRKGAKPMSDDLIEFKMGNNSMIISRKNVKGEYLIDHLQEIDVDIHIDAPKTKRAEAMNQMVNKTINDNGVIILSEKDFDDMKMRCEA